MNEKDCRRIVRERSEGFCERCCHWKPLTLHHRKKRSQAGKFDPSNCVMVCGSGTTGCHGWIEHHPLDAGVEGFHVAPWRDPRDVPILWRGNQWVHLDDEGNVIDV